MQLPPLATRALSAPAAPKQPDVKLDDHADIVDVLKLRSDLPYSDALRLVTAVDSGLDADDAYDVASAASSAIAVIAPTLNETLLGAGLNAVVLGGGSREIKAQHRELKTSLATYKQAPKGEHLEAALGVATAITKLTVMYRTAVNASSAVAKYALRAAGKVPALAPEAASLGRAAGELAATPLGQTLRFLNKWIPLLNATWTLMAFRTAYQVFCDPKASHTSHTLACLNVGASIGVLIAGVWAGVPSFLAIVALGLLLDLGLANSRQVDATAGNMDARMAAAAADPVGGVKAFGTWLGRLGHALYQQRAKKTARALDRLGKKPPIARDRVLAVKSATPA
jgi:hypothetical protein